VENERVGMMVNKGF